MQRLPIQQCHLEEINILFGFDTRYALYAGYQSPWPDRSHCARIHFVINATVPMTTNGMQRANASYVPF